MSNPYEILKEAGALTPATINAASMHLGIGANSRYEPTAVNGTDVEYKLVGAESDLKDIQRGEIRLGIKQWEGAAPHPRHASRSALKAGRWDLRGSRSGSAPELHRNPVAEAIVGRVTAHQKRVARSLGYSRMKIADAQRTAPVKTVSVGQLGVMPGLMRVAEAIVTDDPQKLLKVAKDAAAPRKLREQAGTGLRNAYAKWGAALISGSYPQSAPRPVAC